MQPLFRRQQGGSRKGDETGSKIMALLGRWIGVIILTCMIALPGGMQQQEVSAQTGGSLFLPAIMTNKPEPNTPLIHIPYFNNADTYSSHYSEMAVFWFGKVSPDASYSHGRIGYNAQRLSVEVNTNDRQLWYDASSPSAGEAANWDSVSLYFYLPAAGQTPSRVLRFDAQLSTKYENRPPYQAVYERAGNGWTRLNLAFETRSDYLGGGINGPTGDKGWIANFEIPFSSLGLSGAPASQSEWKMGVRLYDQDSGPGGAVLTQVWPAGFADGNTNTYSRVTFGFPPRPNQPPAAGSVTIKEGPGMTVPDGSVGGHSTCGGSYDYWSEWGDVVYNSGEQIYEVVIQNQRDVSDFPCFSRYYITFPLGAIPQGKVIVSAKLTMRHFGNSEPQSAQPSYIQVFRVKENWSESTLSWNNSPPVYENYPGVWVEPLRTYPGEPGIAYTWDVTQALLVSIRGDNPRELRLALQSGDWAMHSGKYFWSSEAASKRQDMPPILVVEWANP